jgi:menaquinone-dependent protoporphyrinogen oxidase
MARVLGRLGHDVTIAGGDALPASLAPDAYDAVIVGASVIVGRHQRPIERFVRENRAALNALPSAFFSVSASAAGQRPEQRADAHRCLERFLDDTGWRPRAAIVVAGEIAYTRYNPIVRWVLKRITARAGGPTDTTRDHDLTDWPRVAEFATAFAASLEAPAVSPLEVLEPVGA